MRYFFILYLLLVIQACTPVKMGVEVPTSLQNQHSLVKVAGVKGKMLPGAKRALNYDSDFKGQLKDGWHFSSSIYDKVPGGMFSEEAIKRSFLLNFGIGINDVTSKTSDKFQFTIKDSVHSLIGFCHQLYIGKSKSYQIKNTIDYSKGERQVSNFIATINSENDTLAKPWLLNLTFDRETPGGIIATTLRDGMPVETGILTNTKDTIHITPIFLKQATSKKGTHAMPFPVLGGYEFKLNDQAIGWVDLYSTSIGFSNNIIQHHKLIVAAVSTAILLRNR